MIPRIELMTDLLPLGSFCGNDLFMTVLQQRLWLYNCVDLAPFEFKLGAAIYEEYYPSYDRYLRTVVYV